VKKFVIAFAVAATAAGAFAAPHARTARFGDRGAHFEEFAQKLNLSDAQKQQIRDIEQSDREHNKQLYADFQTKMEQYRELERAEREERVAVDARSGQSRAEGEARGRIERAHPRAAAAAGAVARTAFAQARLSII